MIMGQDQDYLDDRMGRIWGCWVEFFYFFNTMGRNSGYVTGMLFIFMIVFVPIFQPQSGQILVLYSKDSKKDVKLYRSVICYQFKSVCQDHSR